MLLVKIQKTAKNSNRKKYFCYFIFITDVAQMIKIVYSTCRRIYMHLTRHKVAIWWQNVGMGEETDFVYVLMLTWVLRMDDTWIVNEWMNEWISSLKFDEKILKVNLHDSVHFSHTFLFCCFVYIVDVRYMTIDKWGRNYFVVRFWLIFVWIKYTLFCFFLALYYDTQMINLLKPVHLLIRKKKISLN